MDSIDSGGSKWDYRSIERTHKGCSNTPFFTLELPTRAQRRSGDCICLEGSPEGPHRWLVRREWPPHHGVYADGCHLPSRWASDRISQKKNGQVDGIKRKGRVLPVDAVIQASSRDKSSLVGRYLGLSGQFLRPHSVLWDADRNVLLVDLQKSHPSVYRLNIDRMQLSFIVFHLAIQRQLPPESRLAWMRNVQDGERPSLRISQIPTSVYRLNLNLDLRMVYSTPMSTMHSPLGNRRSIMNDLKTRFGHRQTSQKIIHCCLKEGMLLLSTLTTSST